jgi:hypothetical protein
MFLRHSPLSPPIYFQYEKNSPDTKNLLKTKNTQKGVTDTIFFSDIVTVLCMSLLITALLLMIHIMHTLHKYIIMFSFRTLIMFIIKVIKIN